MTKNQIRIAALKAAQAYLQEDLKVLLESYCIITIDGTPDRDTLDVQDEVMFITPLENLIDQVKMAVEGKQQLELLGRARDRTIG